MEQPVQKSGMSRGCFVALIIVGALLAILVIVVGLICLNRDKVLRWSVVEGTGAVKSELASQPVAGVDTVQFNRLADSFLVRIETAPMTEEGGMRFVTTMQAALTDKQVSQEDVARLTGAMVNFFPDLEPLAEGVITDEMPAPDDTSGAPDDTLAVDDTLENDTSGALED
jgi:hypothetical protein